MNFQVKEAPFLASNGAYRNILESIRIFHIKLMKIRLTFFFLYKGEYATVFLDYLTFSLS